MPPSDPTWSDPVSQGELKPYTPSWRKQIEAAIQDAMSGMGASRGYAQNFAEGAGNIVGAVPGLGNALSANDAYRDAQSGNYLGALGNAAMALPIPGAGIAEGAAEEAIQPAAKRIIAYHGSPHQFDQFDIGKIGTGEGAQAYGHGLYFAGNEDVAKSYRDALSPGKWSYADKPASETWDASALDYLDKNVANEKGVPAAIDEAIGRLKNSSSFYNQTYGGGDTAPNLYDNAIARLQRLDPAQVKPAGSVYQVNINADPDHFFDWDKPLSQQSPHVQQNLADVLRYQKVPLKNNTGGETTGGQMMGYLQSRFGNDVDAAGELSGSGIPGIKYLDQGSRFVPSNLPDNPIANEARQFLEASGGDSQKALKAFYDSAPVDRWATTERDEVAKVIKAAGQRPTRNYVVFDPSIIEILKRYGLLGGLVGSAGMMAAQPGQDQTPDVAF